jgi:two-component SAPR family response regulator
MPQITRDTSKQLQVLAVVGNNSILNVLEAIFDRLNIEFRRANSSKEAMTILETYQPDAIFVDIWLAGSDGRKLGSSIRQDKRFKNTSIIAISADYNMGASLNKMVFDDILLKPFTQNEVARCLKLSNQ